MSHTSAQRTYPPQKREAYVKRYELDELFDDDDLVIKLQIAQSRIVEAFVHASEHHRGKLRKTDNYIPYVGPRRRDLVEYIVDHVLNRRNHRIVTSSELPAWLGGSVHVLKETAQDASTRLVAIRLYEMCQMKLIWFNGYNDGIWETTQSVVDQYRAEVSYGRDLRKTEERLRREDLHGGGRLRVVH